MPFHFPSPLYPIADAEAGSGSLITTAADIIAAGVPLLQLRVKRAPTRTFVELARAVQAHAARAGCQLIINDRTDIALLVDAAGVHLGQDDLSPAAARALLGPEKVIGVSTHHAEQVDAAVRAGIADYVAFGPLFPTRSKERPDPVQGLAGLRAARARCPLPLVAIGGIDARTVPEVLAAGADAVAVIGAIAGAPDPQAATRAFLDAVLTPLRARPRS